VFQYFGFEELRIGVNGKGHSAKVWASCKAIPQVFRVWGSALAKHPEGSEVMHEGRTMNQVGHILRVKIQDD